MTGNKICTISGCCYSGCWVFIQKDMLPASRKFSYGQFTVETSLPVAVDVVILDKLSKWNGHTKEDERGLGWEMPFSSKEMVKIMEQLRYTVVIS